MLPLPSARVRTAGVATLGALLLTFSGLSTTPANAAQKTPSAPRSVKASAGDQQVSITWTPPRRTGGKKVDRYRVAVARKGSTKKSVKKVGPSARKLVVTGLQNGTRYTFQVAAHNKRGWGPWSTKASAVPRTLPGAPETVEATPVRDAFDLAWSAPSDTGGASVDRYALRVSEDWGQTWHPAVTDSGNDMVTTTSATVTGDLQDDGAVPLSNGSPLDGPSDWVYQYRVEVRAHNVAGWGPWTPARLDPDALVQMPPFALGNVQGLASAAAFRDRVTDSYWDGGYVGAGGVGEWHEPNPLQLPVQTECEGSLVVGCPGGEPQDPTPTVDLDLTTHVGDSDRRAVQLVNGSTPRYDLTYRARITTPTPIAVTLSGTDCTVTVDSNAGASPDVQVNVPVSFLSAGTFPNDGWQTKQSVGDLTVSGLTGDDYTLGGSNIACLFFASSFPVSAVQDIIASAFRAQLEDVVRDSCGADAPYWWQPCYPILDSPPPPPPPTPTQSSCPTGPPAAGPYLTLTCNGSKLVRTCDAGWVDADHDVATGCERSTAGTVPMQLDATTAQALADHLSGSFFLGGYPGGTGTGEWFDDPYGVSLDPPLCGSTELGCAHSLQQVPMPTLEVDLSPAAEGDVYPRRHGEYDAGSDVATLTLGGRVRLTGPVSLQKGDVTCQVDVDSTRGGQKDVALTVGVTGSGTSPLSVVGTAVSGLEDADITFGHRWCEYWLQFSRDQVRSWVQDSLASWAAREATLCGAPEPYFWQRCG